MPLKIKKSDKIFLLVTTLAVIILMIIVIDNLTYFKGAVAKYLMAYGLPSVFVLSFLADFLQQPIGAEIPATFAVVLGLELWSVIILSFIGSILASMLNFYLGKRFFANRFMGSLSVEEYKKYTEMFCKWGDLSMVIAALTPVPYVPFCWIAGAFKMKIRNYILFAIIPRLIRVGFIVLAFKGLLSI